MEEQQFNVGENRTDRPQLRQVRIISRSVQNHMGTLVEGYHHGQHYPDLQGQSRPIPPQMIQLHSGSGRPQAHSPPQISAQPSMSPTRPMAAMAVGNPRGFPLCFPGLYRPQHFPQNYQPIPGGWMMTLPHNGQHNWSQCFPRVNTGQQFQTAHHQYYAPQSPTASINMPHAPGPSIPQSPPLHILSSDDDEEPDNVDVSLTTDELNSEPQPQPEIPDLRGVVLAFNELARKNRELEDKVKTLTLELENSNEREKSLQAKIIDLEEKIEILQLELADGGEQEDGSNGLKTRDLLEENKSLKFEQLELTVKLQMQKMWQTIISDMKSRRSKKREEVMGSDEEDDLEDGRTTRSMIDTV